MHPKKITVWCVIHARGIIKSYFFENTQEERVTVNGDWAMLNKYFTIVIKNQLEEYWFQQGGATSHITNETIALLRYHFG